MRATRKEVENNVKNLQVCFRSYGHWNISITYKGQPIHAVTTNSQAVDDYKSDSTEKDGQEYRKKRGYEALCNECIRKNKDWL